jgi:NADPH:quinone reductase-like Zn-dependent oxidoreductase
MTTMRAAVTRGRGPMEVAVVSEPGAPGPGYPRIQGHEAAGTVVEVGVDCPAELVPDTRVALWPRQGMWSLPGLPSRPGGTRARTSA